MPLLNDSERREIVDAGSAISIATHVAITNLYHAVDSLAKPWRAEQTYADFELEAVDCPECGCGNVYDGAIVHCSNCLRLMKAAGLLMP